MVTTSTFMGLDKGFSLFTVPLGRPIPADGEVNTCLKPRDSCRLTATQSSGCGAIQEVATIERPQQPHARYAMPIDVTGKEHQRIPCHVIDKPRCFMLRRFPFCFLIEFSRALHRYPVATDPSISTTTKPISASSASCSITPNLGALYSDRSRPISGW